MSGDGAETYEPRHWRRQLIGPLFAMACFLATALGVVILSVLLAAIIATASGHGCDVRLVTVNNLSDVPSNGRNVIIVASIRGELYFRVFDSKAEMVEDTSEREIEDQSARFANFRTQLDGLWPPHDLTWDEKGAVFKSVRTIIGQAPWHHPERPWYAWGEHARDLGQFLGNLVRQTQGDDAREAGFRTGLVSSCWLLILTALIAIPCGVGAAVFLEEYVPDGRIKRLVQLNIANLAGVPSIVYGILGLSLFVKAFGFSKLALGWSIWSGALTLALLVLPVIVIATQEALRTVPSSLRHAALALGATRWQMIRDHVVPSALPAIMTGVILSLSRAVGETAPILMVCRATSVLTPPRGPADDYAALPVEIYNYAKEPLGMGFETVAAGGILLLLILLLTLNAVAIVIRHRTSQHAQG